MWCERCRKNVTGAVSGQHDSICCAHCGTSLPGGLLAKGALPARQPPQNQIETTPLPCPATGDLPPADAVSMVAAHGERAESTRAAHNDDASAEPALSARPSLREPLLALESWEIDEDLRHMQRLLRGRRFVEAAAEAEQNRFHAAHARDTALISSASNSLANRSARGWLASSGALLARFLLLAGITTLACGLALLAWWHFGLRADLCAPGLATTIAGQFLLMIGLAGRPDRRAPEPPPPALRRALSDHPLLTADLSEEFDARAAKGSA